jgi:hypothetical protein
LKPSAAPLRMTPSREAAIRKMLSDGGIPAAVIKRRR